ncbi:hypothetical protein C8R44DRAFT_869352 [Mycena epipterygia]|nr:hypothetical protein C8R44DRAFT_869352 [Mycena epipterygia]
MRPLAAQWLGADIALASANTRFSLRLDSTRLSYVHGVLHSRLVLHLRLFLLRGVLLRMRADLPGPPYCIPTMPISSASPSSRPHAACLRGYIAYQSLLVPASICRCVSISWGASLVDVDILSAALISSRYGLHLRVPSSTCSTAPRSTRTRPVGSLDVPPHA